MRKRLKKTYFWHKKTETFFMNILILTHQGDIAGTTYSISYLAKGLAEKGHKVYVGCREESLLYQLLQGTKVLCIAMPFRKKFDRPIMRQIRDIVAQYQIEVINPQSGQDRYNTAFSKMRYGFKAAVVHTRRQRPLSDGGKLQSWFYMAVTNKIVAVSNPIKEQLIKLGIRANHIKVIHNGTPPEKYVLSTPEITEKLRYKYGLTSHDLVIGCVGRHKQQEQLVGALRYLPIPVKLILVGIEENATFKALISEYKVPHKVIFTGLISASETIYHYPLFNAKVLPSVVEGLSQALLEAMAMGVPVIATNAVGNPDLIQHGANGFLFEENDEKSLAQFIQQLLEDKALSAQFKEAGKKTALIDFSIEKTVNNYEVFFKTLISS